MREKPFTVCIHDVTPASMTEVSGILESVRPFVGSLVSVGIVPDVWKQAGPGDIGSIRRDTSEVLLHGYNHRRDGRLSLFSAMVGLSDEFSRLNETEALRRIEGGQSILSELFGKPAKGFVPPAWQMGVVTPSLVRPCGIEYTVGLSYLCTVKERIPLATYSWDCGVFRCSGYGGELLGRILSCLRVSVPCVVFHPKDVARGFVPKGVSLIERLMCEGYVPRVYGSLFPATQDVLECLQ